MNAYHPIRSVGALFTWQKPCRLTGPGILCWGLVDVGAAAGAGDRRRRMPLALWRSNMMWLERGSRGGNLVRRISTRVQYFYTNYKL